MYVVEIVHLFFTVLMQVFFTSLRNLCGCFKLFVRRRQFSKLESVIILFILKCTHDVRYYVSHHVCMYVCMCMYVCILMDGVDDSRHGNL